MVLQASPPCVLLLPPTVSGAPGSVFTQDNWGLEYTVGGGLESCSYSQGQRLGTDGLETESFILRLKTERSHLMPPQVRGGERVLHGEEFQVHSSLSVHPCPLGLILIRRPGLSLGGAYDLTTCFITCRM